MLVFAALKVRRKQHDPSNGQTSSQAMDYRAEEGRTQTVAEKRSLSPPSFGNMKKAKGGRRDGVVVRPRHRAFHTAACE